MAAAKEDFECALNVTLNVSMLQVSVPPIPYMYDQTQPGSDHSHSPPGGDGTEGLSHIKSLTIVCESYRRDSANTVNGSKRRYLSSSEKKSRQKLLQFL